MEKVRDARFDALKGLLILLVVYGHFFTHDATHGVISESLANFIYSFHMPLFVFISGYFSHNRRFGSSIIKLIETYAVFQLIKGLWLHYSIKWLLVMPGPMLWYLFALIIWRAIYAVFCKLGVKITRHWIFLFVALSVGAGFFASVGRMFAFSRTLLSR